MWVTRQAGRGGGGGGGGGGAAAVKERKEALRLLPPQPTELAWRTKEKVLADSWGKMLLGEEACCDDVIFRFF